MPDARDEWKVECVCGRQIADFDAEGLQLLCRSCRRVTTIPYASLGNFQQAIAFAKAQRRRGRARK